MMRRGYGRRKESKGRIGKPNYEKRELANQNQGGARTRVWPVQKNGQGVGDQLPWAGLPKGCSNIIDDAGTGEGGVTTMVGNSGRKAGR